MLKSLICEECGDIVDADDDSVEVRIGSDDPLTATRIFNCISACVSSAEADQKTIEGKHTALIRQAITVR